MQRIIFFLIPVSVLLLCNGCDSSLPDELGVLYPVTITITNDGQPIDNVTVMLSNKTTSFGAWAHTGITDSNGTTQIQTVLGSRYGKGVPEGKYTITLVKTLSLPPELEPTMKEQSMPVKEVQNLQKKRDQFWEQNRIIPKILESSDLSPISLTVEKKTELNIDISKFEKTE
jgi:hypothetical protein